MGTDLKSILKPLLASASRTDPCFWPLLQLNISWRKLLDFFFSCISAFWPWINTCFLTHRSYLLLYCTVSCSTCFYFAHDYVATLTRLLRFTVWFIAGFGAMVPLLRGNPESRAATSRCAWKHRKRQTEAYILLRDHNSVKLCNQRNDSVFHARIQGRKSVQILTLDPGCCARCSSSTRSQYSTGRVIIYLIY